MNSEAQKTQCLSVVQTLCHERFHADFFHVVGHFKLELAEIAEEVGYSLFVRLDSLQTKSIRLFRSAVHSFSVDGLAVSRNCLHMARGELMPVLVNDPRSFHFLNLVHLVRKSGVERAFELVLGLFHAKRAVVLQSSGTGFDKGVVEREVLASLPTEVELEGRVSLHVVGSPADEVRVHGVVVGVRRPLQNRRPVPVTLHGLNSGKLLPQLFDGCIESCSRVLVARVGNSMVDLLLDEILVERALEFKAVVRVQHVWVAGSSHDAGKSLFAHLGRFRAEGVDVDLAGKDVLHDKNVLVRIFSIFTRRRLGSVINEIRGPTTVDFGCGDFTLVVCAFLENLACSMCLNEVENVLPGDRQILSLSSLPELVRAWMTELI